MIAFEQLEHFGVERLHAQAHAIDARVGQHGNFVVVQSGRVGLDANFGPRRGREPASGQRHQAGQFGAGRCVGVPPPKNSVSTSRGRSSRARSIASASR